MKLSNSLIVCGIALAVAYLQPANAQVTYQWQKELGGTFNDFAHSIAATSDGGMVVGGYSLSSVTGNKTVPSFGYSSDYWIVKLNADGNIQWQKVYGGTGSDELNEIVQTADGGYLLGGSSDSPISGNKTQNALAGSRDVWVLRIDSIGNILWQKRLGGSNTDLLGDINETADGGCIIGAYSLSGNGGDKTEGTKGLEDYWIIKLSSTGAIEWQNTIGGSLQDYCHGAQQLPDGGYFISGYSSSPVSFDKTVAPVGPFNNFDAWIMKLDATGNILWQKVIGGSSSDWLFASKLTPDHGAILGMYSTSMISGDKSENTTSGTTLDSDYWIVKIDEFGAVQWENTIGGILSDLCFDITLLQDGGYALAGHSLSPVSGDKTAGNYLSTFDYWVVGVDSLGNVQWDRTYGAFQEDYCYAIATLTDGQIVIAGATESNATGDKLDPSFGGVDYWMVKLRDVCIPIDEVCNTIDDDCDGTVDEGVVENAYITPPGTTTVCQGTPVNMTAVYSGATAQWYRNGVPLVGAVGPGYSATTSGNYTVVTSSDCASDTSNAITITVNKNPKASISAGGATSFCMGGSVTLTELASAGCTYQWFKGGSIIAGATATTYIATTAGNYKCLVTKTATGCFKMSNVIPVTVPCREGEELIVANTLYIYPNPATNQINILCPEFNTGNLIIINESGAEVLRSNWSGDAIDISNLAAGIYIAQIISDSGMASSYFIKN